MVLNLKRKNNTGKIGFGGYWAIKPLCMTQREKYILESRKDAAAGY
jgi:hypothetical protein